MNESLPLEIQTLMSELFEVPLEAVPADLQFGGLSQWDSMGHMRLVMALEERFGLPIDADSIAELISIPAIVSRIQEQINNG